jgi:CheY-like chemotaxis protein
MAQARKILIADPDPSSVRGLTRALRQRGYQVQHAIDGSKALNLAVLRHPDVILFDEACALVDAQVFAQILESNPRTTDIPVVVTASRTTAPRPGRKSREGLLVKPFDIDEAISRIDHLCRRVAAARELRGNAREIDGALAQLPLGDLLQILAMNRRTGRLVLTRGNDRGEIHLANGRPVNARVGVVDGEKALLRLLAWRDGAFAFAPGPAPLRSVIELSMEGALLEGMRQVDEWARIAASLPPPTQLLSVVAANDALVEPHPVTAEVLRALEHPRRLSEVLDLASAPDLEVLSALSALVQRGVVRVHEDRGATEGSILAAAEVHAVRGRVLRGRLSRPTLELKIVVCGAGSAAGALLLGELPGVVPLVRDPPCLRSSFGSLGQLPVSDVLKIDFVFIPNTEAARPLWRPFAQSAVGALVMDTSAATLTLARYCGFELRKPLVVAAAATREVPGDAVPALLRGAPAGVFVVNSDLVMAVRTLLLAMVRQPESPRPSPLRQLTARDG